MLIKEWIIDSIIRDIVKIINKGSEWIVYFEIDIIRIIIIIKIERWGKYNSVDVINE